MNHRIVSICLTAGCDQESCVLHPSTVVCYTTFTLTLLTGMKGNDKSWLLLEEDGFRGRAGSPVALFLPQTCVYVWFQSFHRDCSWLSSFRYIHSCFRCIRFYYRMQPLSPPSDAKLPISLSAVMVCWVLKAEELPSLLTRMLKISSLLPSVWGVFPY